MAVRTDALVVRIFNHFSNSHYVNKIIVSIINNCGKRLLNDALVKKLIKVITRITLITLMLLIILVVLW